MHCGGEDEEGINLTTEAKRVEERHWQLSSGREAEKVASVLLTLEVTKYEGPI